MVLENIDVVFSLNFGLNRNSSKMQMIAKKVTYSYDCVVGDLNRRDKSSQRVMSLEIIFPSLPLLLKTTRKLDYYLVLFKYSKEIFRYLWQIEVIFRCGPACPKLPKTQNPFGRISNTTLLPYPLCVWAVINQKKRLYHS